MALPLGFRRRPESGVHRLTRWKGASYPGPGPGPNPGPPPGGGFILPGGLPLFPGGPTIMYDYKVSLSRKNGTAITVASVTDASGAPRFVSATAVPVQTGDYVYNLGFSNANYNGVHKVTSQSAATNYICGDLNYVSDDSSTSYSLAPVSANDTLTAIINTGGSRFHARETSAGAGPVITTTGFQATTTQYMLCGAPSDAYTIAGDFDFWALFSRTTATHQVPLLGLAGGTTNYILVDNSQFAWSANNSADSVSMLETGLILLHLTRSSGVMVVEWTGNPGSELAENSNALTVNAFMNYGSAACDNSASRIRHVSLTETTPTNALRGKVLDWFHQVHGISFISEESPL